MKAPLYSSSQCKCLTNRHMISAGFTLIELMITIAVLAIIVSIAAPNISNQLANQRVKSTVSSIESALKEAKAESIIRRQSITVVYDSSTPKNITLQDDSNTVLATYNIASQSTINQVITPTTVTAVTFQPNKVMSGGASVTYTVCDSASTTETPRRVNLSSIANINTTTVGSC